MGSQRHAVMRALFGVRSRRLSAPWALLLPVIVFVGACGETRGSSNGEETTPPRRVTTVVLTANEEPERFSFAGEVVAANRYELASKISGNVVELGITEGSAVREGDVIARIDAPELAATHARAVAEEAAARLAAEAAGRQAARYRRLAADGVVTARDLELAEIDAARAGAALDGAQALRRMADENLTYAVMRAPRDGVAVRRLVRIGDLATPGRVLVVLEDGEREVRVSVPVAHDALAIAAGDSAEVALASGRVVGGSVARVVPDAAHLTQVLFVRVPGLEAQAGTFVTVSLFGKRSVSSVPVPESALRRHGSLTSVFVVSSDRAVLRYVRLDGRARAVAGLDEGERVILAPPADLRDGDAVIDAGEPTT